jgi:hypothetical protein
MVSIENFMTFIEKLGGFFSPQKEKQKISVQFL